VDISTHEQTGGRIVQQLLGADDIAFSEYGSLHGGPLVFCASGRSGVARGGVPSRLTRMQHIDLSLSLLEGAG
jgi:hypothetical protein